MSENNLSRLSNQELLNQIKSVLVEERNSLCEFLIYLIEIDQRRLYAVQGYSSLFAFLTEALGLSESSTYKRIACARSAVKYPVILSLLKSGEVHMSAVALLAGILTAENHLDLLHRAKGLSKRDLEIIIAEMKPCKDVADRIRKVPLSKTTFPGEGDCNISDKTVLAHADNGQKLSATTLETTCAHTVLPTSVMTHKLVSTVRIAPLTVERYSIKLTGSKSLTEKIARAKEVLSHKFPQSRLEEILEYALDSLLEKHDPELHLTEKKTRGNPTTQKHSRYIPVSVRDDVWRRDSGRCSYVSADGKRCNSRHFLEYDHCKPFALGGSSVDTKNLRLLCRTHNQLAAEEFFGSQSRQPV